jgi:hypothetical protein
MQGSAMFKMNKSILSIVIISNFLVSIASAQHLSLNITNKGIKNLLNSALKSSNSKEKSNRIIVEGGPIFERINVESFNDNQIIKKINEFVPLNQNEDFVFFFNWSPISVRSQLVSDSLRIGVEGNKSNFNAHIRLSLDSLNISGEYLELCELKKWKCDKKENLYGKIENYSIKLKSGSRIDIAAVIKVKVIDDQVEIKLGNLVSNLVEPQTSIDKQLYKKYGITYNSAVLDFDFEKFNLPPLLISINGEVIEADLSGLREAILEDKDSLAGLLAGFAGKFVAKDLTNILNKEFLSKLDNLKTTFNIVDIGSNEIIKNTMENIKKSYHTVGKNNQITKEKPLSLLDLGFGNAKEILETRRSKLREVYIAKVDNTYVAKRRFKGITKGPSFMDKLESVIRGIVSHANYNITYLSTLSQNNKNLSINFDSEFTMNHVKWKLGNKTKGGKSKLKTPSFNAQEAKKYDVAVALSEPMLNAALKVASKTKLIQEIVNKAAGLKGVYIDKIHLHLENGKKEIKYIESKFLNEDYQFGFAQNGINSRMNLSHRPVEIENYDDRSLKKIITHTKDSIVAVAEVIVLFDELESKGIGGWVTNKFGGIIEGGKIWFPIEIKFMPAISTIEGKTYLELIAFDPTTNFKFKNTYGYPYKSMSGMVEKGVAKMVQKELVPLLKDIPKIDLTPHLSFPGVQLTPVGLDIKSSGHLVLKSNIKELNLKKLSKGRKNE